MAKPTSDQVIEALRAVDDPELNRSIVELGMVRDVVVAPGLLSLTVVLTVSGCPMRNEIDSRVRGALAPLADGLDITINFGVMTDEERANVRRIVGGPGGAPEGGGSQRVNPFLANDNTTRVILVSSGKGGVGKSSVTTNLAVALVARGHSVGVLDADVYGYSIPRMLGAEHDPVVIDAMIVPPVAHGVKCISIGHFIEDGKAVVWRGPMLHKALEQFLTDVHWDSPDYLLVDMPPGTGDVALSLAQHLPRAEVIVVTTPQPAAQKVARLSAAMAEMVKLPVRGVVENMSWFTGDDGKHYEIFGSGGGEELARDLSVPLLARIPLVSQLREGGDEGRPVAAHAPDSETGAAFHELARALDETRPRRMFSKGLKLL
ncbi:MAG: hypothetical protein RL330_720 [Actinomycetota bacterium]|jgi:ATP-binding protein involved in chromosome partitioning